MLKIQSMCQYLDALASSQPTPGGGAAAALTGAQGVALLSMVCRLTLGKKRFAAHEAEIISLLAIFEQQRHKLLDLAQRDTDVFSAVIAVYQLPRSTQAEGKTRSDAIQQALKAAAEIPFALFNICLQMLPLAKRLEEIGNPSVLSDVFVGRQLIVAGLFSAKANVEVNLTEIEDNLFRGEKRDAMHKALANLRDIDVGIYTRWHENRCLQKIN